MIELLRRTCCCSTLDVLTSWEGAPKGRAPGCCRVYPNPTPWVLQGCVLTCHAAPGLGHLYAPLVTLARSPRKALAAPGCAAPPAGFPVASPCVKREAPALGAGGGVIQTPGGALRGLSRCGGGGGPVGGRSAGDRWCGGVAVPQCGLGRRLLGIGGGPPAQPGDGVLTVVETRILVGAHASRHPCAPMPVPWCFALCCLTIVAGLCNVHPPSFTCFEADQACPLSPQGSRGSQAVRADGSGVLRGVRAIPLLRGTLFWFKVDSAASGLPDPGAYSGSALPMPQPPAPGLAPEAKGEVRDQRTAADSDGCNCAGGDAGGGGGGIARWTESFQGPDQGTGRAGSGGDEGCAQSGAADGDAAQRRSKTWHAAHHRPGAAPAFAGVPAEAPPAKRQRQG